MRWHAVLAQRKAMDFQRLITTLQKTGHKDCVLHMHPDDENQLTIALKAEPSRPACSAEVWCALQTDQWFDEYECKSMSGDHIHVDLTIESLAQCMKAADKADSVAMKLARKPMPCISIEIKALSVIVEHTVPVDVWTRTRVENDPLAEPMVDSPDRLVWLPQLKKLYELCDRLAKIDQTVHIGADWATSELSFRVETDTTSFTAKYKVKTNAAGDEDAEVNDDEQSEVSVDIRMLAKILNCYQVNCKHAVMGIMDEVILMQITAGQKEDLKVTYYIPTLIT